MLQRLVDFRLNEVVYESLHVKDCPLVSCFLLRFDVVFYIVMLDWHLIVYHREILVLFRLQMRTLLCCHMAIDCWLLCLAVFSMGDIFTTTFSCLWLRNRSTRFVCIWLVKVRNRFMRIGKASIVVVSRFGRRRDRNVDVQV